MTVVFGGLTPHAPVLIPDIGRQDLARLQRTVAAMRELARQVVRQDPDVVVVVTPHGAAAGPGFGVVGADWLVADFAHHRAPQVALDAPGDPAVARAIADLAAAADLDVAERHVGHETTLDHGVAVPLYYLQKAGYNGPVVPVSVSRADRESHRAFGRAIAQAVGGLGKRTVLLASGDLSHRLTATAPAGYAPEGARFDELVVKLLGEDNWDDLFALDPALCDKAGECGYRSLLVLLGALETSVPHATMLAYEGPFGVGYATATIEVDEPANQDDGFNPAGFARQVVDTYLQTDRLPPVPAGFPTEPRGCFVCLRRDDEPQVCVGAVLPQEATLAQEIARHALVAVQRYAEHHAMNVDEVIHHLSFTVDLLDKPRALRAIRAYDPTRHGLVVSAGDRQGVVLPDPACPDSPAARLAQALAQAGIEAGEPHRMAVFRVERHAELFRPAW